MSTDMIVGVVGAGAMGSGIAQVAAAAGHRVILADANVKAVPKALAAIALGRHIATPWPTPHPNPLPGVPGRGGNASRIMNARSCLD